MDIYRAEIYIFSATILDLKLIVKISNLSGHKVPQACHHSSPLCFLVWLTAIQKGYNKWTIMWFVIFLKIADFFILERFNYSNV